MSHVTRNRSAWAVCAAILALCSTGCMMSPQNGQSIGRRSDKVLFAGATLVPGQDILIEAWNWTDGDWEKLADVQTAKEIDKYTDQNATWYRWPAVYNDGYVAIPAECWQRIQGGLYVAKVRARVDGDRDGLPTFKYPYSYSPWQSMEDVWMEHGYDDFVFVRAQ